MNEQGTGQLFIPLFAPCKGLIIQMLGDAGSASRAAVVSALGDLLPQTLTDAQKSKKASNLLAAMKNIDKTIACEGSGKGAVWKLAE